MRVMRVITSVGLVKDADAPQVFEFTGVLAVRDFIDAARGNGWTMDESTFQFVSTPVLFSVYDECYNDVTAEVVELGWLAEGEVR